MMKKERKVNSAVPFALWLVAKYHPTQTTTEGVMRLKLKSRKQGPLMLPEWMPNEVSPTSTS
jgi:hypothetical protein